LFFVQAKKSNSPKRRKATFPKRIPIKNYFPYEIPPTNKKAP
jgi:hypothetical protein